jgi:hypothetical protein
MVTIRELAANVGFKGTSYNRTAEPQIQRNLPVIDNARGSAGPKISTSIDCYVSGEYVSGKGQRMAVIQRYSIFVSYGQDTQAATMQQVRARISQDFSERYGGTFNVAHVHVPDLLTPQRAPTADAEQFYRGSEEWRLRIARASFDIGTERSKITKNISNIRRRYDL